MFVIEKLILARKLRGKSKKDLAENLNIAQKTLSEWETGKATPKYESFQQVADYLNFPMEFFYTDENFRMQTKNISFRALSRLTASDRDKAIANLNMASLINNWIDNHFNLPEINIPNLPDCDPTEAAKIIRKEWGIEECINNTIHLLEQHGIRVYSLIENCDDYDALSKWFEEIPFILLKPTKTSERSRFDAMHELGHLVLHKNKINRDKSIEDEANQFASEMLMPEDSVKKYIPDIPSLANFIQYKKLWKVSLQALMYRYHKLGLISDWVYRSLYLQSKKWGYDKKEPDPIERETSAVFKNIFRFLKEDNITLQNISNEIYIPEEDLNRLMFSPYSMSLIKGSIIGEKRTIELI